MPLDPSQFDTGTTVGQVALLIAVVTSGVVALRPIIKDLRSNKGRKNYSVIANELAAARREIAFALKVQRQSSEWQMTARELIRTTRMDLIDAGVPMSDKISRLSDKLEEIEDRDTYSEHIIIKEEE